MATHLANMIVLAGDIGGTKTNLGLFRKGKTRPLLKVMETYDSREASDLENIVDGFRIIEVKALRRASAYDENATLVIRF